MRLAVQVVLEKEADEHPDVLEVVTLARVALCPEQLGLIPELVYRGTKGAALVSSGPTVDLLTEVPPIGRNRRGHPPPRTAAIVERQYRLILRTAHRFAFIRSPPGSCLPPSTLEMTRLPAL